MTFSAKTESDGIPLSLSFPTQLATAKSGLLSILTFCYLPYTHTLWLISDYSKSNTDTAFHMESEVMTLILTFTEGKQNNATMKQHIWKGYKDLKKKSDYF